MAHYSVHPVKDTDYQTFADGVEPILFIRTFSSSDRKKEGKAYQNIQIDREMAHILMNIMKEAKRGSLITPPPMPPAWHEFILRPCGRSDIALLRRAVTYSSSGSSSAPSAKSS